MPEHWTHSADIAAEGWNDRFAILARPRCGSRLLHHEGVTVFDRREDEPTVTRTDVSRGRVSVDPADMGAANPSSRRDGLAVRFSCEGCGRAPIELTIAQHKGATEIGWRYRPAG